MGFSPNDRSELKAAVDGWIGGTINSSMSVPAGQGTGTYGDINEWDTSNVNDMSFLFYSRYGTKFNDDIGKWDTSSVTSMRGMFYLADQFNQDIGGWDVSKVTDMGGMFGQAAAFNQDIGGWDIGGWDTGIAINMEGMFYKTRQFNQDIGRWDTGDVTNMTSMFREAEAFNQDIGGWDTGNVTLMARMFRDAAAFNQNLRAWDTSQVTNMADMFRGSLVNTEQGIPVTPTTYAWQTYNWISIRHIPELFKNVKTQKMGRNAVFSSNRSRLRSQLRFMNTGGFQATKGKLSAGSYKKDVVIRRKPVTLKTSGADYIQLKKWRALSR